MSAALQPVPRTCRRFSPRRASKKAAGRRTSDARARGSLSMGTAPWAGKSPQRAGGEEPGAGRRFQMARRQFWGSRGWFSCAGRRPSGPRFSFSGEVVPTLAQYFHFPAQEGRNLAQEIGLVLQTSGLWPRGTILRHKIFIFLHGRIVSRRGGEGWSSRKPESGPRFSFSCAGEPAPCTGETISGARVARAAFGFDNGRVKKLGSGLSV